MNMFDVVTIGETMIRLSPEGNLRWEQADQLCIHVGGSESNTAVGLARLGMSVSWLSRLTDHDFGHRIERTIAAHGVDTRHIVWTDQDRVGTYYFEEGSPPRGNRVIYDRATSAFTRFAADQLPENLFAPGNARLLHVTGISLALGETTRTMIYRAVALAKQAGWRISFDVNYRAKLWPVNEAREACAELVREADLVIIPESDAVALWGFERSSDGVTALDAVADMRGGRTTVVTKGAVGSVAKEGELTVVETIKPVPVVGRLGGGDAFAAGFIYGWLGDQGLRKSLRWGSACAALKYSMSGDLPLFQKSEVAALMNKSNSDTHFR